jgi:DNA repair exonuclease SbcCD ATPase subunit
MSWKYTDPEKVKEYNHQYYLKKTKLKRQTDEYKEQQKQKRNAQPKVKKECPVCHTTFTPEKSAKQKYCCEACRIVATKIKGKLYRQTEEFKEQQRQYRQTEEYKEYRRKYAKSETFKKAMKKYAQSEKGKATQKKYAQSEKGKLASKKFRQSEKSKAIIKKYQKSEKGKLAIKRREDKRKLARKMESLAKLQAEIKELKQGLSK